MKSMKWFNNKKLLRYLEPIGGKDGTMKSKAPTLSQHEQHPRKLIPLNHLDAIVAKSQDPILENFNALGFLDFSCKSDDNLVHTTIKSAEKTPMLHHDDRKSKLSMSSEMNHLMEASSGKYSYGQGNPSELEISQQLTHKSKNHEQTSHVPDIQSERKLSSSAGRRRKRKSLDAKLAALFEVSSSQSGNSTPSSSLSCIPSATPKCNWPMSPDEEQPLEGPSSITQVATQHSANDQAFAIVVVSNILKPASTQRCTNSKSSQHLKIASLDVQHMSPHKSSNQLDTDNGYPF
ncbi:hypothetical protein HKD37_01G001802 [Glycine soja]